MNLLNGTTGYRIKKAVALALMTTLLFFVLDGSDIFRVKPSQNAYAQTSTATCQKLPIGTVTAAGNSFSAGNVLDNNPNTAWIGRGMGAWIQADLGSNMNICDVNIAWSNGNFVKFNFIISVSTDGSTFTNVFTGKSSGTTLSFEKYTVPGGTTGRFVRITVYGNNFNNFAGITELSIDGSSNTVTPKPTANNENIQTNSGAPVQITLTGTDPIAGGDVLTFTVVTPPQHGTLTPGTVSNIMYYTPNTGFSGTDSFTYKATDGQGVDSNIATVTITVNAGAPPPPPPPPPPQLTLYDDFEGGTYTLSDGQTSPNGKWYDNFNGYGSAGVQGDGTGKNNVFFEIPATSTSPSETHATSVSSTQKFSNFELDIDAKTI
ncbi:MAG: discoidin domain-containing protein, partial [Candidatus Nitrosopolaris sp.]